MSYGIDISSWQPADVPGAWAFMFVKLSEANGPANRRFAQQWQNAKRTMRGVYHYARPGVSDGAEQAQVFSSLALSSGFRPGEELWALDVEGGSNGTTDGPRWAQFVHDFMGPTLERLGPRGFLYVGQYFFRADLGPLTQSYNWWLPNYGMNDGSVHYLPFGANPVLHQFSSAGNLDRDVVHDAARWNALVGTPGAVHPTPAPAPTPAVHRRLQDVLFFFQVSDASLGAKNTVWMSDGFRCRPMHDEAELHRYQYIALLQGYTEEQLKVGTVKAADVAGLEGFKA